MFQHKQASKQANKQDENYWRLDCAGNDVIY